MAAAALAGCAATSPPPETARSLLRDDLFPRAITPAPKVDVFGMSESMRRFADDKLSRLGAWRDHRQALIDALYSAGGLRLAYDTAGTRTAAEAFDHRAGNCLSLVVMTATFARHIGLAVRFQNVLTEGEYSRAGDLFLQAGHVNIALGQASVRADPRETNWVTVDFVPQDELRNQRTEPIEEHTVLAMFMNNRAAEALAAQRTAEAYGWVREAVAHDPAFLPAINTLAVIYQRAGHLPEAERALRHVLARDDEHTSALSNLVRLLQATGRTGEATAAAERLARLQPVPPFWHLDRAREAHARGDHREAHDQLRRELRRQPFQHEVHFQLALTLAALGDAENARRHLGLARAYSPTLAQQAVYGAKLERLRGTSVH